MYAGNNSVLSLYTGWRSLVVSVSLWNSVIRIVDCRIVTHVEGSGRGLTSYTTLAFAWRVWTKSRTSVSVIYLQAEVWTWDLLNTKHELSTLPWSLLLFIPRTSISAGTLWLLPCSKPSAVWDRSHFQGLPGGQRPTQLHTGHFSLSTGWFKSKYQIQDCYNMSEYTLYAVIETTRHAV